MSPLSINIGLEPLILEVLTALVFGLFAWKFGLDWALPAFCVLGAGLIGLSWIDLRTKRLPRQITYVTAALGVPLLCVAASAQAAKDVDDAARCGVRARFMGIVYVASRGGMGDGDVRLSPLLGAYLGWLGPESLPSACSPDSWPAP